MWHRPLQRAKYDDQTESDMYIQRNSSDSGDSKRPFHDLLPFPLAGQSWRRPEGTRPPALTHSFMLPERLRARIPTLLPSVWSCISDKAYAVAFSAGGLEGASPPIAF